MDAYLLSESLRRGLFSVIVLINPAAIESDSLITLRAHYDDAVRTGTKKKVAANLSLSDSELEQHFAPRLKRAIPNHKSTTAAEPLVGLIAQLRLLIWIEIILKRTHKASPQLLLEAQQSEVIAKKQVRAVEMVLRALINEKYGDQDALIERLRMLFKSTIVDRWLSDAGPGNILTGTLFSELASIFTHKDEWANYSPLYEEFQPVVYLRENRETIQTFLEDIRFIRNDVAHYKELSGVQVELLHIYYSQLVDPIQRLFESGRTKVDPTAIMNVDASALDRYFQILREDIEDIGERTREIERELKSVQSGVQTIEKRTRRTHLSIKVIIIGLVFTVIVGAYIIYSGRKALALDYRSLGWVTLSPGEVGRPISVQGQVWMGNQKVSFADAQLNVVAQRGGSLLERLDLTDRLNPRQVGAQQAIAFQVPEGTDTLVTCFSVPSVTLGHQYTVVERFDLTERGGNR